MNDWMESLARVVAVLLRHPASPVEQWVPAALGLAGFFWVYVRAGRAFGIPHADGARAVLAAMVGLALVLAALCVVQRYAPGAAPWMWAAAAAGVSLLLVLPWMRLAQRAGLMAALGTWLVSMAALIAVVLLVQAGWRAIKTGSGQAGRTLIRREEVERSMDGR